MTSLDWFTRRDPHNAPGRLSALCLCLLATLGLACSGGPAETSSSSESTGSSDSDSSTSSSMTEATSTAGPQTSTSNGSNVSGTMSTTDAMTDTQPATTTTTTTTGISETSGTTDPVTTGPVCDLEYDQDGFNTCTEDADCEIAGDCCSCIAYNPDMGSPGNCGGGCNQNKCEEWGLSEAVCEQGECVVKAKSCDQSEVLCDAPEPACEDGTLPQVDENCYTGDCLPVEACDWVPDCSYCEGPVDNCKITQGEGEDCTAQVCFADFPECFGAQNCQCLGPIFCTAPFTTCTDVEDGVISCS